MKRAYEYRRISTEQSNFSIGAQGSINERFAASHDIEIVQTFTDEGASGKNFKRAGWKSLIAALKSGKVDYIIVSKYDRLGRNAAEALTIIGRIEQNGVRVLSAMEQFHLDPESPFFFKIRAEMLVNAEFERHVISDRTRAGLWHGRSEGRFLGVAPFGYDNARDSHNKPIIVVNEREALIVKEIFEDFLRGLTLTQVRDNARQKGYAMRGKDAIRRTLSNVAYIGKIEVKGYAKEKAKVVKGLHQPIIDEFDFFKAKELLILPNTKYRKQRDDLYLRGHILCPCGKAMSGSRSKGKMGVYYFYYKCCYCRKAKSHNATQVENNIIAILNSLSLSETFIQEVLDNAVQHEKGSRQNNVMLIKEIEKDVSKAKEKLNRLEDKFIQDLIDSDTYKKFLPIYATELNAKIKHLKDLTQDVSDFVSEITQHKHLLTNLGDMYKNSSIQGKISLLKLVFENPLVLYQNYLELSTIRPIFASNALTISKLHIKEPPKSGADLGGIPIGDINELFSKLKTVT